MKIQWKNLITCIAIPLAVGSLSALLTRNTPAVLSDIKTCLNGRLIMLCDLAH